MEEFVHKPVIPLPRSSCLWLLLAPIVVIGGLFIYYRWFNPNQFPLHVISAIQQDPDLILTTLDPSGKNWGLGKLDGYSKVDQMTVLQASDRHYLANILSQSARQAWDSSACFVPRHGLLVHTDSGVCEIAICFACGKASILSPAGNTLWIMLSDGESEINAFLTAHQIEPSPN